VVPKSSPTPRAMELPPVLPVLPVRDGVRRSRVGRPIGLAGRETFLEAGGESFTLVPCLNDRADWVAALSGWCQQALTDGAMPN